LGKVELYDSVQESDTTMLNSNQKLEPKTIIKSATSKALATIKLKRENG
jgi:hypothetical protein